MPAITADHPFLVKHQDKVRGVLSCFDRVIFPGKYVGQPLPGEEDKPDPLVLVRQDELYCIENRTETSTR